MTPVGIGLVLFAALLHAAWNAALRGGEDRAWSAGWMCVATFAVSAPWIPFVGLPADGAWPYLLASAVLHLVYFELLVVVYRSGDLSAAYPIARGSSPLLVCLGGWAIAREAMPWPSVLGVLLVSGGILAIARDQMKLHRGTLLASLATGACIAGYTLMDGLGVRQAGDPMAYNASLFAIYGGVLALRFAVRYREAAIPEGGAKRVALAFAGGVVSVIAYALVTLAMRHGTMGLVSALRETSVVFAALIGKFVLSERLLPRRLAACATIAIGALLLAH